MPPPGTTCLVSLVTALPGGIRGREQPPASCWWWQSFLLFASHANVTAMLQSIIHESMIITRSLIFQSSCASTSLVFLSFLWSFNGLSSWCWKMEVRFITMHTLQRGHTYGKWFNTYICWRGTYFWQARAVCIPWCSAEQWLQGQSSLQLYQRVCGPSTL